MLDSWAKGEQILFNKKNEAGNGVPLLTVVGESARLEGKFNITESIQIECEVAGEINVEGKLVIGKNGIGRADVRTSDAVIMGQYEGNMVATGSVEISATGRASGNFETNSLMISEGGYLNGDVVMMQRGPEAVPDRPNYEPVIIEAKRTNEAG